MGKDPMRVMTQIDFHLKDGQGRLNQLGTMRESGEGWMKKLPQHMSISHQKLDVLDEIKGIDDQIPLTSFKWELPSVNDLVVVDIPGTISERERKLKYLADQYKLKFAGQGAESSSNKMYYVSSAASALNTDIVDTSPEVTLTNDKRISG